MVCHWLGCVDYSYLLHSATCPWLWKVSTYFVCFWVFFCLLLFLAFGIFLFWLIHTVHVCVCVCVWACTHAYLSGWVRGNVLCFQVQQLLCFKVHHLRYCVGRSALRNWQFQMSKDGMTWTTLFSHENDTSLNEPGLDLWPLCYKEAWTPYHSQNIHSAGCSGNQKDFVIWTYIIRQLNIVDECDMAFGEEEWGMRGERGSIDGDGVEKRELQNCPLLEVIWKQVRTVIQHTGKLSGKGINLMNNIIRRKATINSWLNNAPLYIWKKFRKKSQISRTGL